MSLAAPLYACTHSPHPSALASVLHSRSFAFHQAQPHQPTLSVGASLDRLLPVRHCCRLRCNRMHDNSHQSTSRLSAFDQQRFCRPPARRALSNDRLAPPSPRRLPSAPLAFRPTAQCCMAVSTGASAKTEFAPPPWRPQSSIAFSSVSPWHLSTPTRGVLSAHSLHPRIRTLRSCHVRTLLG